MTHLSPLPFRWAIIIILLIAFFLRLWQLPTTPPGLWYDEAYHGMDALTLGDNGHTPIFFIGNNGREPLWTYSVWLSTSLWGNTPFAIRWVAALAGMLTLPIFYRFAHLMGRAFVSTAAQRRGFALLAISWLAVSWWHLHLSRAGFRPVLLPPLLMVSLCFFRVAILRPHISNWILPAVLSGLFLGLTQYTYLPARLTPLLFVSLIMGQSWQHRHHPFALIGSLWLRLGLIAAISVVIFAPLGYFFWQNPVAFSARTNDVAFSPNNLTDFATHVADGLSLFFGAGHELYRHHLPGRAMLGWAEIPFFWLGAFGLLRRRSRQSFDGQLILLGLIIMLLPTLLATPPVHALRPVGLLPFYYFMVTVGLWQAADFVQRRLRRSAAPSPFRPTAVYGLAFIIIILNGGLNSYDYFGRWATHPDVYREYNGSLVDWVERIKQTAADDDLLIPFQLYAHPTTRYLLHDDFTEQPAPHTISKTRSRPIQLVRIPQSFPLLYVGNIPSSTNWVWLTENDFGDRVAYVSRPPRTTEMAHMERLLAQDPAETFQNRLSEPLAHFIPITAAEIETLFDTVPLRQTQLIWGHGTQPLLELQGYDVSPLVAQANQSITLNFYWHSLTDQPFEQRLFLQLIDDTGQPINQWEGTILNEDMYRWRLHGILPTQQTLWLGPDTPDGAYLVRLGFFDAESGARLPLFDMAEPTDQIQLGLFYVSADGSDPRQPTEPRSANFAETLELVGVTVPPRLYDADGQWTGLPTQLHWRTLKPTDKPYTVFLQLLNEDGAIMTSWDREPFQGLYPTNLWSPDELLMDRFTLPPPAEPLPAGRYRLITGFYDFATWERLQLTPGGDFVEVATFVVE